MRRLILLRHAKAQRAPGEDDFDRPLDPQGAADAAIMAGVLTAEGLVPDRALVSAALRTRQTWAAMGFAAPAEFRRDLYLADSSRLLAAVEDLDEEAGTVMVLSHNPGIHSLALSLLAMESAAQSVIAKVGRGFPTATAAVFVWSNAGRWTYDGLFLVADHGGAGAE